MRGGDGRDAGGQGVRVVREGRVRVGRASGRMADARATRAQACGCDGLSKVGLTSVRACVCVRVGVGMCGAGGRWAARYGRALDERSDTEDAR